MYLMKTLIMISGYAGSGKDTMGVYLARKWGYRRLAFADQLKDEASRIYGIHRHLMDTADGKRACVVVNGIQRSVRDVLVEYGTKCRSKSLQYFVNPVIDEIVRNEQEKFVITDWRYENEYIAIKRRFGDQIRLVTVRINRFAKPLYKSKSETQLDRFPFDVVVENTSSMNALMVKIDDLIDLY